MSSKTNALRLQVESALASRVASPFEYRDRQIVETVPAGIAPVDDLTGGLPRGSLTEIYGPPCSGRTSLLTAALAARTAAQEVCALVDGRDAFDPHSAAAAGVKLKQLLWVRCRTIEQALRATDLLIQGSGFGMIALDLSDTPSKMVRGVPLNVWFRFRRAVENTPTIFVLLEQESNAKACASLVLRLSGEETRWRQASAPAEAADATMAAAAEKEGIEIVAHSVGCLLDGWKSHTEMVRARAKSPDALPDVLRGAWPDKWPNKSRDAWAAENGASWVTGNVISMGAAKKLSKSGGDFFVRLAGASG
jgi:recombination protein RecA